MTGTESSRVVPRRARQADVRAAGAALCVSSARGGEAATDALMRSPSGRCAVRPPRGRWFGVRRRLGHALRAIRLAAMASLMATGTLSATEYARFEWLWLEPERAFVVPTPELLRAGALLNLPSGWQSGDTAVVLAYDGPNWPAVARDPIIGALLDAGAAVLELNGDLGRTPRMSTIEGERVEPSHALSTIGQALRGGSAAGQIMVLGHGRWGEAALAAGGTYAAMGALGPEQPEFRLSSTLTASAASWETRAAVLCEALGWAQGARATPVLEITSHGGLERICRETLLPSLRSVTSR